MIHSNGYANGMHARWRSQNPIDQNRARRRHGPRKGNNDRHPRTGPIVCIDPGSIARSRDYWSKCVLGYIVDYRKFSTFAIKRIIENQWLCHGNIIIHRMGDIFALHFEDEQDQAGVLARTVACFDGALMVFQRWIPGMVPRAVRFPYANLWVRICGLPFEYLNKDIAYTVGHILGHSFEVSPFDLIPGNDYLRIRVCMCLGEPLIPGFFLTCDDGYLLWIQFRYEEVFKYCVRCGRVGHVGVNCTEIGEDIETDIKDSLQRINNRGFVISQAEKSHTMFDLDLRALPSTTKYISSKIRLGRNEGFSVPVDFFEEQVIDFQLGVTPGGRIRPGMRFQNNTQPFSGVVVGHSEAGLYRAPMDVENEDDSFSVHEDDRADILGMERDVFENGMERNSSSTEDCLNGDEAEAQPLNGEPDLPVEIGLVEQVEHSFVEQVNQMKGHESESGEVPGGTGVQDMNVENGFGNGDAFGDSLGDEMGSPNSHFSLYAQPSENSSLPDASPGADTEVVDIDSSSTGYLDASDTVVVSSEPSEDSASLEQGKENPSQLMDLPNIQNETVGNDNEGSENTFMAVITDEWRRFDVDGREMLTEEGKRRAVSDPKSILVPEDILDSRVKTMSFLREMDKKMAAMSSKGSPIVWKTRAGCGSSSAYKDQGTGEEFHTPLLIFDLGSSSMSKGFNNSVSREKKKKVWSKLWKEQKEVDDGDIVKKAQSSLSMAQEVIPSFNDKQTNWKGIIRKRKAVTELSAALVPDCFLHSMDESNWYLEGLYKKQKVEVSGMGVISTGFQLKVDQHSHVEFEDSSRVLREPLLEVGEGTGDSEEDKGVDRQHGGFSGIEPHQFSPQA